jgi:AcrR family transcriptional regulator
MSDSSIPGLAAVQDEVATLLVHGATITDAANAVGLCRTTIYSWIKSEDRLRRALQYGRDEYAIGLRDDLRQLAETALRALMDILRDPSVSPAVRTKTSMFIMKRPKSPNKGCWTMPVPLLESDENLELTEENPLIAEDYRKLREEAGQPEAEAPEVAGSTERDTIRQNSTVSQPVAPAGRPAKMPPASEQSVKSGVPDSRPAADRPKNMV